MNSDTDAAMQHEIFIVLSVVMAVAVGGVFLLFQLTNAKKPGPPTPGPKSGTSNLQLMFLEKTIVEPDDEELTFFLADGEISPALRVELDRLIDEWIAPESESCACLVLEVIGHTDGSQYRWRGPEMDSVASQAVVVPGIDHAERDRLVGENVVKEEYLPRSNIELGMRRAVSVAQYLRERRRVVSLGAVKSIYAYSAGQYKRPDGSLETSIDPPDGEEKARLRRRVELRLVSEAERHTGAQAAILSGGK